MNRKQALQTLFENRDRLKQFSVKDLKENILKEAICAA